MSHSSIQGADGKSTLVINAARNSLAEEHTGTTIKPSMARAPSFATSAAEESPDTIILQAINEVVNASHLKYQREWNPSILSFGHEELNTADADAVGFDPSLLPTACFELELMAQDICGRAAQCMADIENFRSKVLYWRENFWRKDGTRRSFQ
ncbi:hypothetical protein TWF106_006813 [Orbilia oligospora]|uniref:Uncharacterized protein n=1 Tax=Orbilia oligospora TaxID=2813651 RepID=A0A7C8QN02_ORBOL|nr:hypothetical protein TWF788_001985 [Orbilia oligospora]KAF3220066.1 hypothetical protein TWF106_006813 [Orbilia oligospora]